MAQAALVTSAIDRVKHSWRDVCRCGGAGGIPERNGAYHHCVNEDGTFAPATRSGRAEGANCLVTITRDPSKGEQQAQNGLGRHTAPDRDLSEGFEAKGIANGTSENDAATLEDFFENGGIPLHLVGPDGTILRANKAELQLLGYRPDEYVGRNIAEFHADADVISEILARLTRGETINKYPARLRAEDGSIKQVEITSSVQFRDGTFINTRCFSVDVTHRKEMEALVREQEQRLAATYSHANIGISETDASGRHVRVNNVLCAITGYSTEEMLTRTFYENTHPDDRAPDHAQYQRLVGGEVDSYEIDKRYVTKSGGIVWVRVNASAVRDSSGRFRYGVRVIQDITDQRRAVELRARREREISDEARALALLNDANSQLWRLRSLPEGLNEALKATIEMMGADSGDIKLLDPLDNVLRIMVHSGLPTEFVEFRELSADDESACGRALRAGTRIVIADIETDAPNASIRDMARDDGYRAVQSTPLFTREGEPLGMVSTYWRNAHQPSELELRRLDLYVRQTADFIERSRGEEEVQRNEERLRFATEAADIGFWDVDTVTDTLVWPPRVKAMFGISADISVSMADFYNGLHPDDRERVVEAYAAASDPKSRALYDVEYRTIGKEDGVIRWVAAKGRGIFDHEGRCVRVIGVAVDISEEKHADEVRHRLAAIVESSEDAIVSKDLNGIIQTWNTGAERVFGWKADEVIGKPITIVIPPDRMNEEPQILARIRAGERVEHFETIRRRKDGSHIHISLAISPVRGANGVIVGAAKVARDITEKKRIEKQRDLLMAELSHRVKNTLATVVSIERLSFAKDQDTETARAAFGARIHALAQAHGRLAEREWSGVPLEILIENEMAPYQNADRTRVIQRGPYVRLKPRASLSLSLAVHELATNAAKYGALSRDGDVCVEWEITDDGRTLQLLWRERGGPLVITPRRKGFGSTLLERALTQELDATVKLEFLPDGVQCLISIPASEFEIALN